jgi:hypothetical protein
MESDTRLRGRAIWEFLMFVLNGLVFILIGLQLSTVLGGQLSRSVLELLAITGGIAAAVILVRLAWAVAGAGMMLACDIFGTLMSHPRPGAQHSWSDGQAYAASCHWRWRCRS